MLIVTIAALVMAASLGWFAYRLLQEERRRSDARVALLTAALDAEPLGGETAPAGTAFRQDFTRQPRQSWTAKHSAVTPTESQHAVAGMPSIVMLDDDTRRVQSFPSEFGSSAARNAVDDLRPAPEPPADDPLAFGTGDEPSRTSGLFADVPDGRAGDARGVLAIAGVVLVTLLVAGYLWFARPSAVATSTSTAATSAVDGSHAAAPAQPGGVPLELLSLSHAQSGRSLVVRGLVRNPVSGSDRTGVVASVLLLDGTGEVIGSNRAPLDSTRLTPGDDAAFRVTLPYTRNVRRYRVTFRGPDDAMVAHTDKRVERP